LADRLNVVEARPQRPGIWISYDYTIEAMHLGVVGFGTHLMPVSFDFSIPRNRSLDGCHHFGVWLNNRHQKRTMPTLSLHLTKLIQTFSPEQAPT
jgi:hypothetical protein